MISVERYVASSANQVLDAKYSDSASRYHRDMKNSIAFYRERKGLTQQALADAVGIHLTNMNRIENGHTDPKLSRFQQIADVLDVDMTEILRPPPLPGEPAAQRDRREFVNLIENLPDSDVQTLLRIAQGFSGAQGS